MDLKVLGADIRVVRLAQDDVAVFFDSRCLSRIIACSKMFYSGVLGRFLFFEAALALVAAT